MDQVTEGLRRRRRLLLLLEEEKYLLDEWVDLGWRWIDVGLSPFIYIHIHIHIKATDE
jgi:hypothetical protein